MQCIEHFLDVFSSVGEVSQHSLFGADCDRFCQPGLCLFVSAHSGQTADEKPCGLQCREATAGTGELGDPALRAIECTRGVLR